MKKYNIQYLPGFKQDLRNAKNYIADTLQNPEAARSLIDEAEKAILKRSEMPSSYEPIRLLYDPKHAYYRIYVKNFVVYYVVIDDVIEIRRFLYGKRNVEMLLSDKKYK